MKKINIKNMCTSLAFGFYLHSMEEFEEFKMKIRALGVLENSIFSVYDKKPEPVVVPDDMLE